MTSQSTENFNPLVAGTPAATKSLLQLITEAGDDALAQITKAQDAFLQATAPAAGDLSKPATFTIPTLDSVDLRLPTAREFVEAHFSLVDKYVANQKAYADKVLKAFGA